MKYRIEPGIACFVAVSANGQHLGDYIFMKPGEITQGTRSMPFQLLPTPVRDCIEKHFDEVFALPIEERCKEEWKRPMIVEVVT